MRVEELGPEQRERLSGAWRESADKRDPRLFIRAAAQELYGDIPVLGRLMVPVVTWMVARSRPSRILNDGPRLSFLEEIRLLQENLLLRSDAYSLDLKTSAADALNRLKTDKIP